MFEKLRVVSLEQAVAAPLCTRHLADLGAEVIKIERPDIGDFARGYDDLIGGQSASFAWLNYGKKSFACDIKEPGDRAKLLDLIETADVLVSNLTPGSLERIVSEKELAALNPSLVRCYISGYGSNVRRKAFDLIIQAETGAMATTGFPALPARMGASVADLAAGMYALNAILAALLERTETGNGKRIDIAMFDVMLEWMSPMLLSAYYGDTPPRSGMHHPTVAPYGPVTSADGDDVIVAVQNDHQWKRFSHTVLADEGLGQNPDYATAAARARNRGPLENEISNRLSTIPTRELIDRLERADIPYGRYHELSEVLALDHTQQRRRTGYIASHEFVAFASPLSDSDDFRRLPPVPLLGEHNNELEQVLENTPRQKEYVQDPESDN